ncbi:MAG: hypothetical protein ABIF10_06590 [Candidatus Woesearchaeota archaeon]
MVRAKLRKTRYLVALLLTLCFFTIGILLGNAISNERIRYVQDQSLIQRLNYESLQTQYMYVGLFEEQKSCPAVEETFKSNIETLEKTRLRLEEYIKNEKFSEATFSLLKREYTIAQLRYWLLAKSTKETCDRDLATILYFYSTEDECPNCHSQEMVLTYLKKKFQDRLLIFSLDANYQEEPMINILKNVYQVKRYPTIVIDEKVYSGLTTREQVLRAICSLYNEPHEECVAFA